MQWLSQKQEDSITPSHADNDNNYISEVIINVELRLLEITRTVLAQILQILIFWSVQMNRGILLIGPITGYG